MPLILCLVEAYNVTGFDNEQIVSCAIEYVEDTRDTVVEDATVKLTHTVDGDTVAVVACDTTHGGRFFVATGDTTTSLYPSRVYRTAEETAEAHAIQHTLRA